MLWGSISYAEIKRVSKASHTFSPTQFKKTAVPHQPNKNPKKQKIWREKKAFYYVLTFFFICNFWKNWLTLLLVIFPSIPRNRFFPEGKRLQWHYHYLHQQRTWLQHPVTDQLQHRHRYFQRTQQSQDVSGLKATSPAGALESNHHKPHPKTSKSTPQTACQTLFISHFNLLLVNILEQRKQLNAKCVSNLTPLCNYQQLDCKKKVSFCNETKNKIRKEGSPAEEYIQHALRTICISINHLYCGEGRHPRCYYI